MKRNILIIFIFTILLSIQYSCKKDKKKQNLPGNETEISGLQLLADFENAAPAFYTSVKAMNYSIVDNPSPEGINTSIKSGKINTTEDKWELVYSEPLDGTFNFSKDTTFKVKVYSSVRGKVYLKIENPVDWKLGQLESQNELTVVNKWVELSFSFRRSDIENKKFGKLVLLFDAGNTSNQQVQWYFDDIKVPGIDKPEMLFHKYRTEPFLAVKPGSWYGLHAANVSILNPSETPDGKWRMYVRGTNKYADGNHDDIGLFEQNAVNFNPIGGWNEYSKNPVLVHGDPGSYDYRFILDGSVIRGPENKIYVYYKGKDAQLTGSLNGAVSADGGFTFTKFINNPLKIKAGPNDAVYLDNQYYLFYGHNGTVWLSKSSSPDQLNPNPIPVLQVGSQGSFDSHAVNGIKIFKVTSDNRWFLIYQCSSKHGDFPERFHAAYSSDLVNWIKVDTDIPLFMRGAAGEWDQGAIWTGEVLEHDGHLYIYYEGWGARGAVRDRNLEYFSEGRSQVGIAVAKVEDFLTWCDN